MSSGLIFGRILSRKKLIFIASYLIVIIATIGHMLTQDSNKMVLNLIFRTISLFGIASAF